MNLDQVKVVLEELGYIAGIASVLFLAVQMKKERLLEEYKTLQSLEEKFTGLLWKGSEDNGLDNVWRGISAERKALFDSLKGERDGASWPIWSRMSESEKNCYRFTRAGLEILEQAFLAKRKGWIRDREISDKWAGWAMSWKRTNAYVPYVLDELAHWFTPSFRKYLNDL